jgi:signal transduction histidine kinase
MDVKRTPTRSVQLLNVEVGERDLQSIFSKIADEESRDEVTTHDVLARLVQLSVPMLPDYCAVYLTHAEGVRAALVASIDAQKVTVTEPTGDDTREVDRAAAEAWRTRKTVLCNVAGSSAPAAGRVGRGRKGSRLALSAIAAVPMIVRERRVGVMVFGRRGDRQFDANAVTLAEAIALCSAVTLDGVRRWPGRRNTPDTRADVLAIVCHDLRNPLNAIAISADALWRLSQANDTIMLGRAIDLIKIATEHMNVLVQDLLTVAMLESRRLLIEVGPTNCVLLLNDALALTEPLARAKSLRLESAFEGGLPAVCCDRPRVLRVFSNLVGNAIRYTPLGGAIRLGASVVDPDFVRFVVSDTGPGIASDQLPRLFDHSWTAKARDISGLGLGLSIAQGIVEAQGGKIWAENRPGEGAAFYFTLPTAA